MTTPKAQNPNDSNAPVFVVDATSVARPILTEHDGVTYVMALGVALVVGGGSLLLLSNVWPHAAMMLIGAICLATASVVWVGLFGYFTWKVVETGRIAVPIIWRRIRR